MIVKKVLLLIAIWCSFTIESLSSQERISGSNLVDLVIQKLSEQGVSAQPFIKKNRIFTGCSSDKIVISKRDKSWKTIRLTCTDNSSWRYSFRNKVTGTPKKEHSLIPTLELPTKQEEFINNLRKSLGNIFLIK